MFLPLMLTVMYLFWCYFYRNYAMVSIELRYNFYIPDAGKAMAMILGVI